MLESVGRQWSTVVRPGSGITLDLATAVQALEALDKLAAAEDTVQVNYGRVAI